jgi:hypothetical protein
MSPNDFGYVITEGKLSGIDTSTATDGQSVWLSGTAGGRVYGSPPSEPAHSVFLGVVTKANASTGEIFVKVQNGYEIDELHDVSAGSPSDGDLIQYVSSTGLWTKKSLSGAGIAASGHTHSYASTTHASTHEAAGSDPLSGISPSQISGTAVITSDSRLSDARTPTAHASTHNAGGSDALAIDAVAATGSLRTLGTTATSAAAGNHAHSGTYVTPGGTVTLTGNVTGSATMSSSGAVSINTTIASIPSNTVTLGTDTTGNYVAGLTAGTGVTVSGTAAEGWSPTVAIGQAVGTTSNVTFNNVTANGTATLNGTVYLGSASTDIIYGPSLYGTSTITNSQDVRIFYGASSGSNYQWRIFRDTSSRRYKQNITHIDDTDKILDVQPVTYYDKADYENSNGNVELQYGLIAEEMADNEVGTNYVVRDGEGNIESVQYSRLVVPLLSAMRAMRTRIEELEKKVAALES